MGPCDGKLLYYLGSCCICAENLVGTDRGYNRLKVEMKWRQNRDCQPFLFRLGEMIPIVLNPRFPSFSELFCLKSL